MSLLFQEIQDVRSLRKDIRNPKPSPSLVKCIETIHKSMGITAATESSWKKVEWRNAPSSSGRGNYFSQRSYDSQSHRSKPSIPLSSVPNMVSSRANKSVAGNSNSSNNSGDSDGFRTIPHKYVSRFKKTSEKVEDTILNTIILGKLNKFSKSNYNEIKEFITHIIDSGQTDMIRCFMKRVFEKAASEEIFCPLYAKLLSELSERYPVILTEIELLYDQYMEIFEEVEDGANENYNELCQRNTAKKYRRGYSQFLTELIRHNVINTDAFMKTIHQIIRHVNTTVKDAVKLNEEFADCLMKILRAIMTFESTDEIDAVKILLKKDVMKQIQPFTIRNAEYEGISNKARFTFLDLYEGIMKL